ncbi:MAG: hypothetical protein ACXAE3_15390 [Candidatus Kariarchaeaceae archaeon]|jgi:hypothetical protein
MSLNTWSRSGSEKAQASQTIRILIKTLQYLAEDAARDDSREKSFLNVASAVIKTTFAPSPGFSTSEQVSVVLNSMGWKNTQIKLTSADEAEILMGSNRHLDQQAESVEGLELLIKTLGTALGGFLFDREVNAVVEIDIHTGPTYLVKLRSIQKIEQKQSQTTQTTTTTSQPSAPVSTPSVETSMSANPISPPANIETSQIFLPVLNNKLPLGRLHLILQDVLSEFANSWYGENPLDTKGTADEEENVVTLVTYLTNKAIENNTPVVDVGAQIGAYYGEALKQTFQGDELFSPEILEGSAVGSIIRDIKARAFCHLKPGDTCGPNIGGEGREICDFAMGLWQGALSKINGEKQFNFTGFYPAGRRDPYCLMEFEVV